MSNSEIVKLSLSLVPFVTREEPTGAYWQLDSTKQILRASGDNAYIYVPVLYQPGSILYAVKVRWGGGGTGDGIYANLQRRQGEGTNKYFSDVTTVNTFTRGATDPEQQVSSLSDFPITLDQGYSYVIHLTSQVAASYSEIYDLIIYTNQRLL